VTRIHARTVAAIAKGDRLLAPEPGFFVASVRIDDVVHPGSVLGTLDVLGTPIAITADAHGRVVALADPKQARVAVDHGALLVELAPVEAGAHVAAAAQAGAVAGNVNVFRAPTSGRFYSRSAPDKPVFVKAGDRLAHGATICLLEVMKTFHRVTYAGEPVTVREVLVADGADVNAGDPLIAFAD
jgi:biotin carboxyl carrier protein